MSSYNWAKKLCDVKTSIKARTGVLPLRAFLHQNVVGRGARRRSVGVAATVLVGRPTVAPWSSRSPAVSRAGRVGVRAVGRDSVACGGCRLVVRRACRPEHRFTPWRL